MKNTKFKLVLGIFALLLVVLACPEGAVYANAQKTATSSISKEKTKVNSKIQKASDRKVIVLDKYAKKHGWNVNYYDLKRKKNYLKVKFEFENEDWTCEVSQVTKFKKVKKGKKWKKIVVTYYYQEGVKVSLPSIKKVLRE